MGVKMDTRMQDIRWRDESVSRMVLGTAQLGMTYGIANEGQKITPRQAGELVNAAWGRGVRFFDTAQAYGCSEVVLGEALRAAGIVSQANVITKLSPSGDPHDAEWIRESVDASRRKLGTEQLWGLLLHRENWLDHWDTGLGETLRSLRENDIVRHVGVSVYSVSRAMQALEHDDVDIIQLSCNAWDQRMLLEGVLNRATGNGKLCFLRSIFLQGLLAMPIQRATERLAGTEEALVRWEALAAEFSCTPTALAVRFALSLKLPLVIGMEKIEQLEANIELLELSPLGDEETTHIRRTMSDVLNERILNPDLWEVQP